MATEVPADLRVKEWEDTYFVEWLRDNRYSKYMGGTEGALIQVRENLMKKRGDTIVFELVNRLSGSGKIDNQTLEGFEEDISQRSDSIGLHLYRHGVVVQEFEEQATAIDLRKAGRGVLMNWSKEHTRDKIHTQLGGKESTKGTVLTPFTASQLSSAAAAAYISANATALNLWLTQNSDRVLFGAAKSNASSGVFDTALGTVDSTSDKLTGANLRLWKRIAKNANPRIRPLTVNGDEEWYVAFVNSWQFRDLMGDSEVLTAHREAWERGRDNPLFTGGDIIYDGIIVREIPELTGNIWTGEGASSIDVGEAYLCGAQAMGMSLAQRWTTRTDARDYGAKNGIAIQQMYEMKKLVFGTGASDKTAPKDFGVCTGFFSSVADS